MIRKILCPKCGNPPQPMHPEDVANGFHRRFMQLKAIRSYVCDYCNDEIPTGTLAIAQTFYRGAMPEVWEEEFGTPWMETLDGTQRRRSNFQKRKRQQDLETAVKALHKCGAVLAKLCEHQRDSDVQFWCSLALRDVRAYENDIAEVGKVSI